VYLLGLYLGDGCISRCRRVWRLRVFQDQRYQELIAACEIAIAAVSGNRVGRVQKVGCVEIAGYWKHWPCVFPQHGIGRKHERSIVLESWQTRLVDAFPKELVRGLIHSDGCRAVNRVFRPTRDGRKEYRYTRYFFSNASPDIRGLFTEACAAIGVACRPTTERNISVARLESVALLDSFIGPKR
jgi:hypothetical protein